MTLLFALILGVSLSTLTWATTLQPHKYGQRISVAGSTPLAAKNEAPDNSPIQRPFLPFSDLGAPAGPIRSDGTFKSRVPEDTLPAGPKDTYTTLDKLQKVTFKKGRKGPFKKIRGSLGGLDPREVYYADEDLIIIKGGGFQRATYEEPPQEITEEGAPIPISVSGNLLSPHEEYNGNIPSFVPPPPAAATRFSPLSLFLPSFYFPSSQTSNQFMYLPPPRGQRGNIMYYCYHGPRRGWHPVYRSRTPSRGGNSHNVVGIPPRGGNSNSHNVVGIPQRVGTTQNVVATPPRGGNYQNRVVTPLRGINTNNVVPTPTRGINSKNRVVNPPRGGNPQTFQLKDLNRIQTYRYPTLQNPHGIPPQNIVSPIRGEKPQTVRPLQGEYEEVELAGPKPYTPRLRTLVGDTRVNFLAPLPQINPDAETIETTRHKKPII